MQVRYPGRSLAIAACTLGLLLAGGGPAQAVDTGTPPMQRASQLAEETTEPHDLPRSFAPLARELLPTVVNIATRQVVEERPSPFGMLPPDHPFRRFFEGFPEAPPQQRERQSLGSGFIIDGEGYIVTNEHVIREADSVMVVLQDDTRLPAEVVGVDRETDLALLKVDTPRELPAAVWGASEEAEVGDWVLAIGNPFGLGGTVTAGIVSARGRAIDAGPYSRFIQTDTAINRGNSGGPLFSLEGEVIGVNTAILSPTGGNVGVGFALPSRVAEPVIAQLKDTGEVVRGWLGVSAQPVTEELAAGLELPAPTGALVAEVMPDSPAEAAGLRTGDVILSADGETVDTARDLAWEISSRGPGAEIVLRVFRDGEETELRATLGPQPDRPDMAAAPEEEEEPLPPERAAQALGLRLAPAVPEVLDQFGLPRDTDGVVITAVRRGSPAEARGLEPGDVIRQVGRQPVSDPETVYRIVQEAIEQGVEGLVVLIQRGDQARFVSVPFARA